MIRATDVSRSFGGRPVLHDVSLRVDDGEVVGLLGPNGAGKTTTIRILLGLLRAHGGAVEIERPVGFLPEQLALYDGLTARGYLTFLARAKRVGARDRSSRAQEVDRVLDAVGLTDLGRRPVARLSRGQRQRLAIAQALLGRPRSLVLDEPTAGLDPTQVVDFRTIVREAAEGGAAVLVSTHVLAEAATICDRVVVIAGGKVVGDERVTSAEELEARFLAAVGAAQLR